MPAECTIRQSFYLQEIFNNMSNEIYNIFKRNLPFIMRDEQTSINILNNENTRIYERRNENGDLFACAVINKNTILLLVVDKEYRNKGIGTELLLECEKEITAAGYDKIILGVGFDYFMPGVPTSKKYAPSVHENLDSRVTDEASTFFEKRGYIHSWGECNCFDMKFPLKNMPDFPESVGDTINGVLYRWATPEDIPEICKCADDACQYADDTFSVYYKNESMYVKDGQEKVLVAVKEEEIVGALIVSRETDGKDLGSVGCTSVAVKEWKKGIATTMVKLGTKYLRDTGLPTAYLSYTYSGLDKMYGAAGYEIFVYYFMGEKKCQ